MGKLIAVVGNSGVGKTTLTRGLVKRTALQAGVEELAERPFQQLFAEELNRFALANQLDFLLYRAEQEMAIRNMAAGIGIQDGGLDQDYHVFSHHFYEKGYLGEGELALCGRFYALVRSFLPPPDLIIYLTAPLEVIQQRYKARGRPLEIARLEDLFQLERLIRGWIDRCDPAQLLVVDAGREDFHDPPRLKELVSEITTRLQ